MNENQFSSLLALIVPQIINIITDNSNITDIDAISEFYNSKLYSNSQMKNQSCGTTVHCFSTQCIKTNC